MVKKTKRGEVAQPSALKFIILIGIVSMFADMTYEGARSITGPYLAFLGANALTVGFVAGFGELVGYGLRMVSGYLADRTGKYWAFTIAGYICNLLAIPLLALTNHWMIAAALIILERMGKAIRTPPRDAMLSHAAHQTGLGWGFGLHESLDQLGAMLGPLFVAVILYFQGSYHECFAVLAIPAIFALTFLFVSQRTYPNPHELESSQQNLKVNTISGKGFWLYLTGACLIAAGFADFPFIAYHFAKTDLLPKVWVPLAYSIAMGVDGLAALLLGRLYDKKGFIILIIITIVTSLFSPLVFLGDFSFALLGVALWSIGVGAHESLMRAIVANMIPKNKRASAYGVFNMGYGIAWFAGSVLMGALYDFSIPVLVVFSLGIQLTAIPFLVAVMRLI